MNLEEVDAPWPADDFGGMFVFEPGADPAGVGFSIGVCRVF
jgi:hypothetical protein